MPTRGTRLSTTAAKAVLAILRPNGVGTSLILFRLFFGIGIGIVREERVCLLMLLRLLLLRHSAGGSGRAEGRKGGRRKAREEVEVEVEEYHRGETEKLKRNETKKTLTCGVLGRASGGGGGRRSGRAPRRRSSAGHCCVSGRE